MRALYQVSVRQATISLSLLLAHISRCKPWESLWGSLATTPLGDFHHRLTACPSYQKNPGSLTAPGQSYAWTLSTCWYYFIYAVPPRFRYASSRSGHSPYRPFAKYPNESKLSPDICLMPALLIA